MTHRNPCATTVAVDIPAKSPFTTIRSTSDELNSAECVIAIVQLSGLPIEKTIAAPDLSRTGRNPGNSGMTIALAWSASVKMQNDRWQMQQSGLPRGFSDK